ncbi:MAG: hypothetical protein ACI8UX_001073, partial [Psychromonas sp.]
YGSRCCQKAYRIEYEGGLVHGSSFQILKNQF